MKSTPIVLAVGLLIGYTSVLVTYHNWSKPIIAQTARAQEPLPTPPKKVAVPTEIKTRINELAVIAIESKGQVGFVWDEAAFPPGKRAVQDGAKLYLTSPVQGKFLITSILFDEKQQYKTTVVVGPAVDPPPAPDTEPDTVLKLVTALDAKFTQLEQRVKLLEGAKPPPVDPPKPPPSTDVAFPLDGKFRVFIIEETADRAANKYSNGQVAAIVGSPVRDWLNANCAQGAKNKDYRIWDKDVDPSSAGAMWVRAMDYARKGPVPGIIVSNGATEYRGELPKDDVMPLLKKMKGGE